MDARLRPNPGGITVDVCVQNVAGDNPDYFYRETSGLSIANPPRFPAVTPIRSDAGQPRCSWASVGEWNYWSTLRGWEWGGSLQFCGEGREVNRERGDGVRLSEEYFGESGSNEDLFEDGVRGRWLGWGRRRGVRWGAGILGGEDGVVWLAWAAEIGGNGLAGPLRRGQWVLLPLGRGGRSGGRIGELVAADSRTQLTRIDYVAAERSPEFNMTKRRRLSAPNRDIMGRKGRTYMQEDRKMYLVQTLRSRDCANLSEMRAFRALPGKWGLERILLQSSIKVKELGVSDGEKRMGD
ncbi:hypothetical protein BDK51DRAFT_29878 [Blyttiomyces helicus]|uniref:Uncharacterized protein n=1 Tax=Blyttiomyces helicus TaxID=388810 RepID=A0A4P9WLR3_9FUNG|nr:hypothetical protein BDK51DRAFT_29878 [Blyttiomyces helicus]|eukprot:RKO93979.1 hypothetical protein BDK51DRAFT_29878 [Blyttiomyces helicus]